jgi:TetR/AcrR family transcriptional regulator, tetracycline repressor protein
VIEEEGRGPRRSLSRDALVARGLEIGNTEGLAAVSLRRLASDLQVTPMALYRHVHDKQDLINAMTERVLEGFDLSIGFEPEMSWNDRIRRAMWNYKEQMDARPLALPLSIAYTGDGPEVFWRMSEDLLVILLEAGFERRQAIILIRVISNLLGGYLMLLRQGRQESELTRDERELDLVRRRVELAQLSLPPDRFPNLVASAHDMAEVWINDPDTWWRDTVDLITFGLERLLERSRASSSQRQVAT